LQVLVEVVFTRDEDVIDRRRRKARDCTQTSICIGLE